jgi:two-component system nitrate/nitrite response regulator NarL
VERAFAEPAKSLTVSDAAAVHDTLIVSEVRFFRDSLVEILTRETRIRMCGQAATLSEALASALAIRPAILLLDVAFPGGAETAARLCCAMPDGNVIALGIGETVENVLAWAEAGIAGYIPNTASIEDLITLVEEIGRGEQTCPSRIAGGLLRRIASTGRGMAPAPALPASSQLTRRESEILELVRAGLSNKDIARSLRISLGTTKSHVHNILAKLCLHRRTDVMTRTHARLRHGIDDRDRHV